MSSKTPRTDDATVEYVPKQFARLLELELNQMRDLAKRRGERIDELEARIQELEKLRKEAGV